MYVEKTTILIFFILLVLIFVWAIWIYTQNENRKLLLRVKEHDLNFRIDSSKRKQEKIVELLDENYETNELLDLYITEQLWKSKKD